MKKLRLVLLASVALLFTACLEVENKNHPPFEPKTVQTDEQKVELMKLVKEARANYDANKAMSTH